jgi:hypothetical protein
MALQQSLNQKCGPCFLHVFLFISSACHVDCLNRLILSTASTADYSWYILCLQGVCICLLELPSCKRTAVSKTIDFRIMLTKLNEFYSRAAYSLSYIATSRKEMDWYRDISLILCWMHLFTCFTYAITESNHLWILLPSDPAFISCKMSPSSLEMVGKDVDRIPISVSSLSNHVP